MTLLNATFSRVSSRSTSAIRADAIPFPDGEHEIGEAFEALEAFEWCEQRTVLTRLLKDSALSVLHREGETRALDVAATSASISRINVRSTPSSS